MRHPTRHIKSVKSKGGTLLKAPVETSRKSGNNQRPVFSLYNIVKDYCVLKCTNEEKVGFAEKLRELSNLTWNEIINAQRHGMGSEKIKRVSILKQIPKNITEETTFLSLRFSGKKAMVGYRDLDVFHIVWLDRNYEIYNHGS